MKTTLDFTRFGITDLINNKTAVKISMIDLQLNRWQQAKKSQEPDYYQLFLENLTYIDLYSINKNAFQNWVNDFSEQNCYFEISFYSNFKEDLQELEDNFDDFKPGIYQYFWEEFSNQIIEILQEGF